MTLSVAGEEVRQGFRSERTECPVRLLDARAIGDAVHTGASRASGLSVSSRHGSVVHQPTGVRVSRIGSATPLRP